MTAARWRQIPFFVLGLAYLLTGVSLLRAGCNGINHADGTGEGLIAAAIGLGGGLSVTIGALFCVLGARAHRATVRAYRFRIAGLVLGLLPFAIYGWIALSRR
jgi:hypothetical protein